MKLLDFRKVGLYFCEIEVGKVLTHVESYGGAQNSSNHVSLPRLQWLCVESSIVRTSLRVLFEK